MHDEEPSAAALEAKFATVFGLLQHVADALLSQKQRVEDVEARLLAQRILTASALKLFRDAAPEGFGRVLALLERSHDDLAREGTDATALKELQDILAMLRHEAEAPPDVPPAVGDG
jgi:hypothetical protein